MLGYGCGVSKYPQFYAKYLDMYQVLPRPYIGSFDGFPEDKLILKYLDYDGTGLKPHIFYK